MNNGVAPLPPAGAALQELERAIERLEQALATRESAQAVKESLKEPVSGQLLAGQAELFDAREDYARLDHAAREIEAGLDDLISRLKSALKA